MDQPNNLMESEQEILKLEAQLNEAAAAEQFFNSASGKLAAQLATLEIDRLVKRICSDEFLKDHTGYVNAVCEIKARRDWLKRLQVAASPVRRSKIQERLDDAGEKFQYERKSS